MYLSPLVRTKNQTMKVLVQVELRLRLEALVAIVEKQVLAAIHPVHLLLQRNHGDPVAVKSRRRQHIRWKAFCEAPRCWQAVPKRVRQASKSSFRCLTIGLPRKRAGGNFHIFTLRSTSCNLQSFSERFHCIHTFLWVSTGREKLRGSREMPPIESKNDTQYLASEKGL